MSKRLCEIIGEKEIHAIAKDLSSLWWVPYQVMVKIVRDVIENPDILDKYEGKREIEMYGVRIPYGVLTDIMRQAYGRVRLKKMKDPIAYRSWFEWISERIEESGKRVIETINLAKNLISSYYQ